MNMNLDKVMKQAQQMQKKILQAQESLAHETVEATVGGGMVTAKFTGKGDIVSISIDPEVINPDDKDMLEDLIVSAVTQGIEKSRDLTNEKLGGITGALGLSSMGLGL